MKTCINLTKNVLDICKTSKRFIQRNVPVSAFVKLLILRKLDLKVPINPSNILLICILCIVNS